jgi:hypothetical protein
VASIAWFDKQFSKEITKDKKDLALSHDGLFHTLLKARGNSCCQTTQCFAISVNQ